MRQTNIARRGPRARPALLAGIAAVTLLASCVGKIGSIDRDGSGGDGPGTGSSSGSGGPSGPGAGTGGNAIGGTGGQNGAPPALADVATKYFPGQTALNPV